MPMSTMHICFADKGGGVEVGCSSRNAKHFLVQIYPIFLIVYHHPPSTKFLFCLSKCALILTLVGVIS